MALKDFAISEHQSDAAETDGTCHLGHEDWCWTLRIADLARDRTVDRANTLKGKKAPGEETQSFLVTRYLPVDEAEGLGDA
jgi:hypothetical protein